MNNSISNKNELLKLQKLYRKGKIKEEEIPEDKLIQLKELYHEQIELLKKSIEQDKQKIINIRKKLK